MAPLLLLLLSLPCASAEQAFNVVIITIDTLRADHLGCYGYASIRTPRIDELAREGTRFTHAYTPVPITLPAHAALMTGEFPLANGVHDFSGNKLPAEAVTLAKVLHQRKYATAAFVASAVLDSRFGMSTGFDTYFDHFDIGSGEVHLDAIERRGDQVVDQALAWLKTPPSQPFLLWVHLYDPHAPYRPPEPFASRYRGRPYDGEIAFADAQVGRLFAFLRQQGIYDRTLIVLASDHGEGLGEHGEKTHGFFIYNSTLHVPLVVRMPGIAPRVVADEVSLVDVMPTVLQAAGIPIPPTVQGRGLLSLLRGRASQNPSNVYAESYPPLIHFGWNFLRSVQWQGLKYIDTTRPELYDTRTDPGELHDLLASRQAVAQEMKSRLQQIVRRYTPAASAAVGDNEPTDPALLESLRSLGYVAVSSGKITDATGKSLPDPKDRIQVYELVEAALSDNQNGRYPDSLLKLQQAENMEPNSSAIQFLLAQDYFRLKDFPHSAQYFRSALKLNPNDSVSAYYLGLSLLQTGDLDGAGSSFERALDLDAKNFNAAFNLGVVCTRKREPEAAVQAFQRAIEILPDFADAHEALGELYLYLGRAKDAAQELERAVAIAPQMTKAHYQLGRAYSALGQQEKAKREFDRAKGP